MFFTDSPTPKAESRSLKGTLLRLSIGAPLRDWRNTQPGANVGPTWFRSAEATKNRPSLNPCRDWPGWTKLVWRLFLYFGLFQLGFVALRDWLYPDRPDRPFIDGWSYPTTRQTGWIGLALAVVLFLLFYQAFNRKAFKRGKKHRLPAKVLPDLDMRGDILKPPIGKTYGYKWHFLNLALNPHILAAAKSGKGKTTFLLSLIWWFRIHGGLVTLIDPKRTSFIELRNLPGIEVVTAEEGQLEPWYRAVKNFHDDMMIYYGLCDKHGKNSEEVAAFKALGKRFLIIDEFGTFVEKLKEDWEINKPKGARGRNPAILLILTILRMGREAGYFMVAGATQANRDIMLSTEARSLYSNKISFANQSDESWIHLMGRVRRIRVRNKPGRGIVHSGDEFVEFQAPDISDSVLVNELVPALAALECPSYDVGIARDVPAETPSGVIRPVLGNETSVSNSETEKDTQENEIWIVGRQAAADFLGMTKAAFDRATAKDRKPLPPGKKIGKRSAWTQKQLEDWRGK